MEDSFAASQLLFVYEQALSLHNGRKHRTYRELHEKRLRDFVNQGEAHVKQPKT